MHKAKTESRFKRLLRKPFNGRKPKLAAVTPDKSSVDRIRSILNIAAGETGTVSTILVLSEDDQKILLELVQTEAVHHAIQNEPIGGTSELCRDQYRLKTGGFLNIIVPKPLAMAN